MCRLLLLAALSASAPPVFGLVAQSHPKKNLNHHPPSTLVARPPPTTETGAPKNETGAPKNETGAPLPKVAVFSTIVGTADHYKGEDMVTDAAYLLCSARRHGSKLPFHLIYGGGIEDQDMKFLKTLGWNVQVDIEDVAFFRSLYKPVWNERSAKRQGRVFTAGSVLQRRHDGWATYFKFNAWLATQYEHVLLSDVDVVFNENPDPLLDTIPEGDVFEAFAEKQQRTYVGLNTHMVILKPSHTTFKQLCEKANSMHYIPYTNTEQDIVEDTYKAMAMKFAMGNMTINRLKQTHQPVYPTCGEEVLAKLKADPEASCEKLHSVCGVPKIPHTDSDAVVSSA